MSAKRYPCKHPSLEAYESAPDAAEVRLWPVCKGCDGLAEHPAPPGTEDASVGRRRSCSSYPEECAGNYWGRMHPEQLEAWERAPATRVPYPFGP